MYSYKYILLYYIAVYGISSWIHKPLNSIHTLLYSLLSTMYYLYFYRT